MEVYELSAEPTTIVVPRKKFLEFIKRSGIFIKSIFLYPFKKFKTNTDDHDRTRCMRLKRDSTKGCLGLFNMRRLKRSALRSMDDPDLLKSSECTTNGSAIYSPYYTGNNSNNNNNTNNNNIESKINREIEENNRIVDKGIFKDCTIENFEVGNTIGTGSYATVCIAKFNKNFGLNGYSSSYRWFEGFKGSKEISDNININKSKSLISNIADNISNFLGTSKKKLNNTIIGCENEHNGVNNNNHLYPYSDLNSSTSKNQNQDSDPYYKLITNLNTSTDLDFKLKLNLDKNKNTNKENKENEKEEKKGDRSNNIEDISNNKNMNRSRNKTNNKINNKELFNCETKIVALKILNKVKLMRTKQLDHVKSEADILSRFNHPFIVGYYGRFQDKQNLYFILEFVGGGELFYYLRKVSRFSADTARFYCSQVLLALDFLHSHGFVYRDLKPENILLDYLGYIRLVDFGFAKSLVNENYKMLSRILTNNNGYTDSKTSSNNNSSRSNNSNNTNNNNNKEIKEKQEKEKNTNNNIEERNKNNYKNNNNINSKENNNNTNKEEGSNYMSIDNRSDSDNHFNYNSYNNVTISGLHHNYNSNFSKSCYNRVTDRTYTICGTCEYLAPEVFLKKGHGLQADFYSFGVLLYELLVGIPPFYSHDPQTTYDLVLSQNIDFPRYLDKYTKDIIKKLLKIDPNKRIGKNIRDIYKHPFFINVNFDDLLFKRIKAPIIPNLKSKEDISNFAKYPEVWKSIKDEPDEEEQLFFEFF